MTTFVATSSRGRRRRIRMTLFVALLLAFALVVQAAPAEARTSPGGGGPTVGDVFRGVSDFFSPVATAVATAGKAVGSWFNATFLTAKKAAAAEQTPVFPGEVPWKRTATTRTVRNANGSYTVDAFTHPVNYLDSGVWQPIDNRNLVRPYGHSKTWLCLLPFMCRLT